VDITRLTNLSLLGLDGNKFSVLPMESTQLPNLRSLFLADNKLTTLPSEIGQLTNLSVLALERNQLKMLPVEIGQLTNLNSLYLNDNHLTLLPVEIGQMISLSRMYLTNNQLTTLPAEITQLEPFRYFDLDSNCLCLLPDSILNWVDIYTALNLDTRNWQETQNCSKVNIQGMAFQSPSNLNTISISPNPFNPTTTIRLHGAAHLDVRIYDLNGHLIRTWFGRESFVWNGQDLKGRDVASGTYIVRVNVGERVMSRRIVLMR